MSDNVRTILSGSQVTVRVDNTDADEAATLALAAATSVQQIGADVQAQADAAIDQNTEATAQLLSILAQWVPPGAVMNLGSPINLLLAGE